MIHHLKSFTVKLIPFALVVFALHSMLQYFSVWPLRSSYFYVIHLFNSIGSASLFLALAYSLENLKDKAGFIYLALSILKMLLVMVLMAVVILGQEESSTSFALQFMVVYGMYLSFEVVSMVKKLNS